MASKARGSTKSRERRTSMAVLFGWDGACEEVGGKGFEGEVAALPEEADLRGTRVWGLKF
jgi:hypothetical protein